MKEVYIMEDLLESLKDRRKQDWIYSSGRIFSSMCSKPLDEALESYKMFMDTNALDSEIFPSVRELEDETIEKIGSLLSNPNAGGYITSGGTEGNIYALWLARKLKNGNKVIAPDSVHYSIKKACDLQQLDLVLTPTDSKYKADLEGIKEEIDRDTFAVIATAGTTALGKVDPISQMGEIAGNENCFFHVDASFGGFILPFIENDLCWDFKVEGVSSITVDSHKMGLTPIPSGTVLVREEEWLDSLGESIPYIDETSFTLSGSRPGGSVASIWAVLNSLGTQGYEKIVGRCMRLTRKLAEGIQQVEGLEIFTEPELNVVSFTSNSSNLCEIREALRERGWLMTLNEEPESARLVVMPHHRERHINSFLAELREISEGRLG